MKPGWEMVIGLEVHSELKTATKLFCGCPAAFGDDPNTNVCPVCLGLPGSLPVVNQKAVELAMAIGTALRCEIRPSTFHRKNYFYPDQAKDYQITQYDEPINVDGHLDLPDGTRVRDRTCPPGGGHRQDLACRWVGTHPRRGLLTGRLQPVGGAPGRDRQRPRHALLRPGPGLRRRAARPCWSPRARPTARWRRARCESMPTCRSEGPGTQRSGPGVRSRTSIRSDRWAGPSTTRPTGRSTLLESGERVHQQTRHWDEDAGRTVALRSKEEAYDYRYFLEPDLVPLAPDAEWIRAVGDAMGPMPAVRTGPSRRAVGRRGRW